MTIIVNITDTFEEWRLKNNELATDVADLSNNVYTINVIASGNITASGNIFALGNTVVSQDIVGAGNLRLTQDASISGNVTAANIRANVHYQTHVTSKPAINVIFTGNITGSSNIAVANSGTNILTISANVATDSVTLGTHTIGDYVKSISSADTNNVIVSSGSGEGSTPTVNLAMTAVTPAIYGNSSVTPSFTVDRSGRITAASNNLITPHYLDVTNKPAVNVNFTGNITGSSNIIIANSATNILTISANVAGDSVTLGTHTVGDYVKSMSSADTANIIVSSGTGEGSTPTLNLAMTAATPGSYGNANAVPQITVDRSGRITSTANLLIDRSYSLTTKKPSVNLKFTGDVTGTANLNLSNENTNQLDVTLTMNADSITLGTDTTGNYTDRVVPGTMITVSGTADEGNVITINHSDTSTLNGAQGGSGIAGFTVDDRGHVTAVTTATYLTDTVTTTAASYGNANVVSQITLDTKGRVTSAANVVIDRDYALTTRKPSINLRFVGEATGNGNITISNSDKNEVTIEMIVATIGSGTLPDTAVSPGTYGGSNVFAAFTVDSKGRLTAASNVAMSDTGVAASTYGNASVAPIFTVDSKGRISSAANAKITPHYLDVTNKPAVNINFTGDVTGKANVNLSSNNTNLVDVALTIATNSVALGTDTTGSYTDRVLPGTGISATGTADEGNVITVGLTNTAVTATTYGNATIVPVFTVDQQGRITSASNVNISGVGGAIGICNSNNLTSTTLTTHPNIAGACHNFFAGCQAGQCITTGRNNIFMGFGAGLSNNSGSNNVALGVNALAANGSGNNNIAIGLATGALASNGNNNTFLGCYAGYSNETGSNNFFAGACAGYCNKESNHNIFIGQNAGFCSGSTPAFSGGYDNIYLGRNSAYSSTLGYNNFVAGPTAGYRLTSGNNNFLAGAGAGCALTTGSHNIIIGCEAGNNCLAGGCNNVFLGQKAGCRNASYDNTFIGRYAGQLALTGSYNTFIGVSAGRYNQSGQRNHFFGINAGRHNGSGSDNIFLGFHSGYCNTDASHNFFAGFCAGRNNITGSQNTFIGSQAGFNNTTGGNNIYIGQSAGYANTGGENNTFLGYQAGYCNTYGCMNTYIGFQAGYRSETAQNNNFMGFQAGCANTTGSGNQFFGNGAGVKNTSGSANFFFGSYTGCSNTTGCNNVFIGSNAGIRNTIGTYNIAAGRCAGRCLVSGSRNITLGHFSGANVETGNDNIILGCLASSAGFCRATSNTIVLATGGVSRLEFINSGSNFTFSVGTCAGNALTSFGGNNVFVGNYAGRFSNGSRNIAIGCAAGSGQAAQSGNDNIFLGLGTGSSIENGGDGNNIQGTFAGTRTTTGCHNHIFGYSAGFYNTTGSFNTFFGYFAGGCNVNGSCNFFAGHCAGFCNTSGRRNIYLGQNSGGNVETGNDNIVLGCLSSCAGLSGSTSNVIILATGGNRKVFFDSTGNAGVGTSVTSPTATWDVGGNLRISGAVTQSVYTLSGTTPALNPTNGTIQTWTLTGTSSPTDSFANGQSMTLLIDDGSAYTITWPSVTWKTDTGSAPTLLTTGNTVIALWKVNSVLYGARVGNN